MSVKKMGLICYIESIPKPIGLVIEELKNRGNVCAYAYVLHDKDVDGMGNIKKPHYHLYLEFVSQQNPNTVAKMFGVSNELIQNVSSKNGYISYFVHAFDPNKYQYKIDDVVVYNVDVAKCIDLCTNVQTDDIPKLLFDMRMSGSSMLELLNWALDFGYLDIYKRYYQILKECVCY